MDQFGLGVEDLLAGVDLRQRQPGGDRLVRIERCVEGVFGVVAPLRAIIRPSAAPRPASFQGSARRIGRWSGDEDVYQVCVRMCGRFWRCQPELAPP